MAEFRYEPPNYAQLGAIRTEWEGDFRLSVAIGNGGVVLRGNREGLLNLARHLVTLAQNDVPSGSHIHYDPGGELEDDSVPMVIERASF